METVKEVENILRKVLQRREKEPEKEHDAVSKMKSTTSGKIIGIGLAIVLACTLLNGTVLQSTIKIQSDTGEWIYFMQNSTQWKNEDFDTSDTSYG